MTTAGDWKAAESAAAKEFSTLLSRPVVDYNDLAFIIYLADLIYQAVNLYPF